MGSMTKHVEVSVMSPKSVGEVDTGWRTDFIHRSQAARPAPHKHEREDSRNEEEDGARDASAGASSFEAIMMKWKTVEHTHERRSFKRSSIYSLHFIIHEDTVRIAGTRFQLNPSIIKQLPMHSQVMPPNSCSTYLSGLSIHIPTFKK